MAMHIPNTLNSHALLSNLYVVHLARDNKQSNYDLSCSIGPVRLGLLSCVAT